MTSKEPKNSDVPLRAEPDARAGWESGIRAAYMSLLLLVPGLWAFASPDTSDLNRRPIVLPAWELGKSLDPSYYQDVGDALADRVGVRRIARRGNASLAVVLGDSPSTRVVAGRESWFFYSGSLSKMVEATDKLVALRRAVLQLRKRVVAGGRDFRMVVAPNKETIYPEKLSAEDERKWRSVTLPKITRFRAMIGRRGVDGFIDIGPEMEALARDQDELLYERLGSHWVDRGALKAVQLLVESLSPELWARSTVKELGEELIKSDFLVLAGATGAEMATDFEVEMEGYVCERRSLEWTNPGSIRIYTSELADRPGAEPLPELLPPTVLVHDSFGFRMAPLLAPFFEKLTLVRHSSTHSERAREVLNESELVIFEAAERNFYHTSGEQPTVHWEHVRGWLDTASLPPSKRSQTQFEIPRPGGAP